MARGRRVNLRVNCIMADEYDRRVARALSMQGYFLRQQADGVMCDAERWDRDSPLYRESRLTYHLLLTAAIMIEDLAKRTITKGLPKRERALLVKLLAERAAKGES